MKKRPDKKIALKGKTPNQLTAKTIADARMGIGLNEPIKDIKAFLNSL